jgi:hypothetical protein
MKAIEKAIVMLLEMHLLTAKARTCKPEDILTEVVP